MAKTPSTMAFPLNATAPSFELYDTISGNMQSLNNLQGEKGTVIMFICNHCPFVQHLQSSIVNLANEYMPQGISFIAISSNDITSFPEDAPNKMKETAQQAGYPFVYLFDETQETAKAFQAACTPDFFLFDAQQRCVYRGRFDDSTPGNNIDITGKDLRQAVKNLLDAKPPLSTQYPSIGCNIKWKE